MGPALFPRKWVQVFSREREAPDQICTMAQLPVEVIAHVLYYVPPYERLNLAFTASNWAQALYDPVLMEDVSLVIESCHQMEAFLSRSRRKHQNLRILNVDTLEWNGDFWAKIGKTLRELEIARCTCSPQVLLAILRACSSLESVNLTDLDVEPKSFLFVNTKELVCKARHLQPPRGSTKEMLNILLSIMPEVTSLSLSFRSWESDIVTLISNWMGPGRVIKELEFSRRSCETAELIRVISLCSASVEVLTMRMDWLLAPEAFEAIGDCTNLRRLSIDNDGSFLDYQMKKILSNNPGLETLELEDCESLTEAGLAPLLQLKNFRRLSFRKCKSQITNEFLRSLETISSLQEVDFEFVTGMGDKDVDFFRSVACLSSLRTWSSKCSSLKPECVKVMLEDFKNLTALTLTDCYKLTKSDWKKLRKFKQLRSLEIQSAQQFTNAAVRRGLGSSALESLTLHNCALTDNGLARIGAHRTRLKTCVLSYLKITNAGLIVLLRREPLLESLTINGLLVTDEVFKALENLCPRLRYLKCRVESREKLECFSESFRSCKPATIVDLSW